MNEPRPKYVVNKAKREITYVFGRVNNVYDYVKFPERFGEDVRALEENQPVLKFEIVYVEEVA